MDDEQKPDPSLLLLHLPNHHKVASLACINRSLSYKEWMEQRKISQASNSEGVSSRKVQSVQPPTPQTQTGGLLMIKDEPWEGPPGLSPNDHLASAARAWIGPSNKSQTPPNQVNNKLPFSSGNPNLQTKAPSLRPIPQPKPTPATETASFGTTQGLYLFPKTATPTRPRTFFKRKAGENRQSDSGSKMRKSADNLICHLCNASCSSAFTMQQHLKGRHHKAKMRYMSMKRGSSSTAGTWGRKTGNPRCELCEIWCSDVDALRLHFKGHKHKAKMQELQACKERGGQRSSKAPIICELCGVPCMNQDCFQQHLKGRQHAAKLELKRRGFL